MFQLVNETPFAAAFHVLPEASGADALFLTVKATFRWDGERVRVAEEQRPLVLADEPTGDAGKSSLRYASEVHLLKPATDVVLVGSAHAPSGRPEPRFGVSLSVGSLKKVIHVHGDRVWKSATLGLAPSPPVPTASIPLVWERAYGGIEDLGDGKLAGEPRNPVGCGFVARRPAREVAGRPVPNLEDPAHPLRAPGDRPPPAGVGFVAPHWQPRAGHAGTCDEAWARERAPYLPRDFDPRFFQAAPADQVYPGYLQGGEPVELLNLSRAGPLRFTLPVCAFDAEARLAGELHRPPLQLETLLLEPDEARFSLLWRGAVGCHGRALRIEAVTLRLRSMTGASA